MNTSCVDVRIFIHFLHCSLQNLPFLQKCHHRLIKLAWLTFNIEATLHRGHGRGRLDETCHKQKWQNLTSKQTNTAKKIVNYNHFFFNRRSNPHLYIKWLRKQCPFYSHSPKTDNRTTTAWLPPEPRPAGEQDPPPPGGSEWNSVNTDDKTASKISL